MMRQMVGMRKGMKPSVVIAIGRGAANKDRAPDAGSREEEAAESADEEQTEQAPDEITCAKCGCRLDAATGEEIASDDTSDESLDESDSAYSKPGPFGAAADAARGSESITKQMGTLGSLKR